MKINKHDELKQNLELQKKKKKTQQWSRIEEISCISVKRTSHVRANPARLGTRSSNDATRINGCRLSLILCIVIILDWTTELKRWSSFSISAIHTSSVHTMLPAYAEMVEEQEQISESRKLHYFINYLWISTCVSLVSFCLLTSSMVLIRWLVGHFIIIIMKALCQQCWDQLYEFWKSNQIAN